MAISLESSSTPLTQMYPPDPRTLYTWQRCGHSHAARYATVSWPYQIVGCTQVENRPCRGNNRKEGFELRVLLESYGPGTGGGTRQGFRAMDVQEST